MSACNCRGGPYCCRNAVQVVGSVWPLTVGPDASAWPSFPTLHDMVLDTLPNVGEPPANEDK